MGNYTYRNGMRSICKNGKHIENVDITTGLLWVSLESHLNILYSAPLPPANLLEIDHELLGLKFVSCGEKGYEGYAIEQLVSIFDIYTWLLVIASVFVSALALKHLAVNIAKEKIEIPKYLQSLSDLVYSMIKLLLEKDLDRWGEIKNGKLRLIATGIMLAITVLSNVNKNENVYNMILPLKALKYDYLAELVKDNFKIYTRTREISSTFDGGPGLGDEMKMENETTSHSIQVVKYYPRRSAHLDVISEVEDTICSFTSDGSLSKVEVPQTLAMLRDSSSLPPMSSSNIEDAFVFGTSRWKKVCGGNGKACYNNFNRRKVELEVEERYMKNETKVLYKVMENCSRSALVLPNYLIRNHSKTLRIKDYKHVFVGTETYINFTTIYTISEFSPAFIFRRIKIAVSSGLFKRWEELAKRSFYFHSNPDTFEPTKAKLEGNISIIFILFVIGMFISIGDFLFEIRMVIVKISLAKVRMLVGCRRWRRRKKEKHSLKVIEMVVAPSQKEQPRNVMSD